MSDTADHAFAELFQTKKPLKAPKGQLLITPGEEPKGVMYIHKGYVKAYDIDMRGSNQIIALYGPGDIFPLTWTLESAGPQLFYEALNPLTFSVIARSEFTASMRENPLLLRRIIDALLCESRHFQQRIQNLELKSAHQKVVFRLLFLASRFGRRQGNHMEIAMPIRYQDLAESLNLSRDTVNRVMRELIHERNVEKGTHNFTINDISALTDILGTDTTLEF